ncbi:glycosyltransferase [Flavobacterium sp. K5-23]|uniref:glycosyltransferase family 2 protein n=1 Tax=Flavobacterium sp. K5-23 TaxID=2746225 RepID=UPI00200E44C3|nr:glycosyltransferase [Flavobacterium sp. K5-23]UQD57404.1 glycosyltransferase [Flavobacterium sp. K5-23]
MNSNPKISVIIPCYNNEKTIIDTVKSVIDQEYTSIEIIIINDGSTDNSLDIVTNYISKNNLDIILINQKNTGASKARNNGALQASGKYLLFLDADDIISKCYLRKCIQHLEQDKTLNIVYSGAEYFGARKGPWKLPEYSISNFLESNCIPVSAVIKRDVFNKVGGFDENLIYTEDWELWIKIIKDFGGVYKINEPLFFYRKNEDKSSITDNSKNLGQKSTIYIYNKHYDFFSKNKYDIETLLKSKDSNEKYKKKYYNVWYRKLFYKITKK